MPQTEDTQPGPAWCLTTKDEAGVAYICTYKAQHPGRHKMVKQADMRDELRDALNAMTTADLAGDPTSDWPDGMSIGEQILGPGAVEVPATGQREKEMAERRVAAMKAELEGDPTGLRPADPPTAVMQTMHELAELVGLAEIDRRFDMLSYTTKTLIGVAEELRVAKVSLADDRPVDPAVMERIKKRVDGWLLQVGAREDGGS